METDDSGRCHKWGAIGTPSLLVNQKPQDNQEGAVASMPDAAANVAGIYVMLCDDVLNGMATTPDFGHALQLSGAVLISSLQGTRQDASGWPTN